MLFNYYDKETNELIFLSLNLDMTPDHLIVVKYVDIVIRIQNNFLISRKSTEPLECASIII